MRDCLIREEENVVFINGKGIKQEMPNLSKLIQMHRSCQEEAIKKRIHEILSEPIGKLLMVEIMMDMTNDKIIERIHTGEISKTMKHVQSHNVILDSHMEQAKHYFNDLNKNHEEQVDFESIFFAQFPYGMVVEERHLEGYYNKEGIVQLLDCL